MIGTVTLGVLTLAVSFVTGLLDAGGAVLFIPTALAALPLVGHELDIHAITALALAQGVVAVLGGGIQHARDRRVSLSRVWLSGPVLAIGGFSGSLLSALAPARLLVLLFAVVTTAAALVLFLPSRSDGWPGSRAEVTAALVLLGVGALGGAVGVGAGVLIIPVLIYLLGMSRPMATGTGLVLPAFLSGPALVGKAVTGQVPWELVPVVAVAGLLGATLGARVHASLPSRALRSGQAALLGLLAVLMWARVASSWYYSAGWR